MDRRDFLANASAVLWAAGLDPDADPAAAGEPASGELPGDSQEPAPGTTAEAAAGTPAWYDVTAYGASPSAPAATNDAAFAAALAAIPPAGGVLYVPTGTYAVAAPVALVSNVLVQGDGMNATVLRQTSRRRTASAWAEPGHATSRSAT